MCGPCGGFLARFFPLSCAVCPVLLLCAAADRASCLQSLLLAAGSLQSRFCPAACSVVTKRRNGCKCISNQALEQEITKGAHTHNKRQPTNAGQQRSTSLTRKSPNQATVHAAYQGTAHISHRTLCEGTCHRHGSTAPTAGATGSRTLHTQLKARPETVSLSLRLASD